MKQADLAKLTNLSVSYLSLIEQGKRDPNISIIENIAGALNVPVSILVFLSADKSELKGMSAELIEKLSVAAIQTMGLPGKKASRASK